MFKTVVGMNSLKSLFQGYSQTSMKHAVIRRILSFKVLDDAKLDLPPDTTHSAKARASAANSVLEILKAKAKAGGGSKAIHRHTEIRKKLLVRERLKLLFDEDSPFLELGTLAGLSMDYGDVPCAGSVVGIGTIHGHYCIAGANDATVKGGSFFPITVIKQHRLQHLALLNKLPCIYLVDSGGAFLPLQAEIFPDKEHGGRTFYNEAVFSALGIPQLAVVCGSSTAGGAYCPTMAEETIIVNKSGVIFLGGPPLVKAATGEIVSEQELGGAELHCSTSGCTDYFAETETEAFEMCRETVLALNLPQNIPCANPENPVYPEEELNTLSGKEVLDKQDIYRVIARIFDGSKFKEFKRKFGANLITGFAFLSGRMVGVLANCGPITWKDAQKGSHFIQLCDKRHVPIIFLQNSGGSAHVCDDDDDETLGLTLKERAKMAISHSSSKVPKVSVNIGGCFGDENFTMCGLSFEPNFLLSWPLARAFSEQLENTKVPDITKVAEDVDSLYRLFDDPSNAFCRASRMMVDDVILPSDTRKILSLCLDIASSRTSHAFEFPEVDHVPHSLMRM